MRETVYAQNSRRERIIARNKARRNRQLRNHIVIVSVTLCLVLIFSFILGSFLSEAKEKSGSAKDAKCFKSVMVMYGETLENVSAKYFDERAYACTDDYTNEILSINSISDPASVRPGQYIVIPYLQ